MRVTLKLKQNKAQHIANVFIKPNTIRKYITCQFGIIWQFGKIVNYIIGFPIYKSNAPI